jgi:hypothetical protein
MAAIDQPLALRVGEQHRALVVGALPHPALSLLADLAGDQYLLAELAVVHQTLWSLEDGARSRGISCESITDIKRAIDRHNGHRHRLIDAFDATIQRPETSGPTRRFSETVGEICDRLLIIDLKFRNANRQMEAPDVPMEAVERCRAGVFTLTRWRDHLHICLLEEMAAIKDGTASLPPRQEFKMYNDPILNPVTRRELMADQGSRQGNRAGGPPPRYHQE